MWYYRTTMEQERKISGSGFFYWQLPVFLLPYLFILIKLSNFLIPAYRQSIQYEMQHGYGHGVLSSLLLNILNPFSSSFIPFLSLIWLVMGVLGLVFSTKILLSQKKLKAGLIRFIISGFMILIPTTFFINSLLVGMFVGKTTQFQDLNGANQQIIKQALTDEFSKTQKIVSVDSSTDQFFPIFILEDDQKIQLYNFNSNNISKFNDFKQNLIGHEVSIKLPDNYLFQPGQIPQVLVYFNGELINDLFSSH